MDVEYNNPNDYADLVNEEIPQSGGYANEKTEQDSQKHHEHHAHESHDAYVHQHEHEHKHEHEKKHDTHKHEHHNHEHHHHHHHSDHLDNDGFVSIAFEIDRPFDVKKFETFLQTHLPSEVFRAKGILWFTNSEDRHIFQLSGARFNLNGEPWQSAPKNQLVFIGRNLDADRLRQHLTDCFA